MTTVVQIENLTQDDLTAIIRNAVRDELAGVQPEQKTQFLTRAEAADMLHLTLPTLHAYTKSGVIKAGRLAAVSFIQRMTLRPPFRISRR